MKIKRFAAAAAMLVLLGTVLTGCKVIISPRGNANTQLGWQNRPVVRGSGQLVDKDFEIDQINRLKLVAHNGIQVEYLQGEPAVTLSMQEDLFKYVTVEERDGKLTVEFDRGYTYRFGSNKVPVLTVTAPTLQDASIEGMTEWLSGDAITGDDFDLHVAGNATGLMDLEVENVGVQIAGAGGLELRGSADRADIGISGAGDLSAKDLAVKEVDIRLDGAGSVEIACEDRLDVTINGVGTVSYWGDPVVNKKISGMGTVERK